MVKQKKKRSKKYSGIDAAIRRPNVTRITATSRSKISQWFFDNKKIIRIISLSVLVVAALVLIISGIVSLFH